MKKGVQSVLILLLILAIPTPSFAASGWQHLGTEKRNFSADSSLNTYSYIVKDGGNFKVDINGTNSTGNYAVTAYVNGSWYGSKGVGYFDGDGYVTFSGLSSGDVIKFSVYSYYTDNNVYLRFYD